MRRTTCHDADVTTTLPVPTVDDDVVTPAYASWRRRFVAALLDGAVLGAVAWLVGGDALDVPWLQPTIDSADVADSTVPWTSSPVLVGAWLVLLTVQGLTGQTPGRRVLGIEVVRVPGDGPAGGPPGVLRSIRRWLAHFLDALLLIGYLRPLWHPERRTFADSLVGTVVVHRAPPPRGDRRAGLATGAAWVAVVVGVVVGLPLGDSGGVDPAGEVGCTLAPQPADAPLRVRDVTVVREVEWRRTLRLWTWVRPDVREARTDRVGATVDATWETTGSVDPGATLVLRVTAGDQQVEQEALVEYGVLAGVLLEDAGAGPVDVELLLDGRTLTSCSAVVDPA